jgi:hypothetical protein
MAITLFISPILKPQRLATAPPITANTTINLITFSDISGLLNRNNPTPANFKRIPANIIEPYTGASTCALGSHICTPKIGNFTRNAVKIITVNIKGMAYACDISTTLSNLLFSRYENSVTPSICINNKHKSKGQELSIV